MRLAIVVTPKLHVAVGARTLCGDWADPDLDGLPDRCGLLRWNEPDADRCAQCERVLYANRAGRRTGRGRRTVRA